MKFLVRCSYEIEVELPDDCHDPQFVIEENSCPGTGAVGAALYSIMDRDQEKGVCWACNLKGENKIVKRIE